MRYSTEEERERMNDTKLGSLDKDILEVVVQLVRMKCGEGKYGKLTVSMQDAKIVHLKRETTLRVLQNK